VSLHNSVKNHYDLIYNFTVEGIEYGSGEGKTQGAAADNAATKALSGLREQYGDN
jgi:dsRNA-specific ribonuclease